MMKVVMMHKNGNPTEEAVVSVVQKDVPTPGQGEILVKVHSAAINPIDYKLIQGDVPGKKPGSCVGFDVAGVVEKVGDGCTSMFKVGDEVYADAAKTQGSLAEYAVVQERSLAMKPTNLTMREAASLPLAALTAIQGLTGSGVDVKGARVGILGGSGGVGSLAIQIAKALGSTFVVTTSSNVEFVKALGADQVINYREENVVQSMAGLELDLVFDCVGGMDSWNAAKAGLKKSGGKFATIVGDSDVPGLAMLPGIVNRKFWSMFNYPSYRIFLTDATKQADLMEITRLVEKGKVQPMLDERHFALETGSVHELMAAIKSHRTKGKLVLDVVSH